MCMVSIIVPVYNAEKTLRRCIDSILAQTYPDFELLLIDDGSTDNSGAICEEYARQDQRLRVIHKENSGVSSARNTGLDHAQGTYLQFLDSDDWITPDATSSLVRAAETHRCGMVIADFYRVVGERVSHKGDIDEDTVLTREEFSAHMMENPADYYYGVLWNKLYRREIVERYHLRMNPEISWCEDFMFNLEYIRRCERFYALQIPIYYYVKTKGSLVSTQGISISRTIKMKLTVFEYYNQFFKTVLDDEEYEKSRLKVYRYLIDAAKDGAVVPLVGGKKLGNERIQISPDSLSEQGILADSFRQRKLLDRCMETAALKNGLTLPEAYVLLGLSQKTGRASRKEVMDFLNLSRGDFYAALQRLSSHGLLQWEEARLPEGEKDLTATLLPAAQPVLEDLSIAQKDYQAVMFSSFTQEQIQCFQELFRQLQENIRHALL